MDHEAWYDAEIAPALLVLSEMCKERGVSFLAAVEYAAGEIGRTVHLPPNADLAMVMLNHCAQMGRNVDGYILGLQRYCTEQGIDTTASLYLRDRSASPPVYRPRLGKDVILSELPWIRGTPAVEVVAAHEEAYPSLAGDAGHPGGTWLCIHIGGTLGDHTGLRLLHVARPGDRIAARTKAREPGWAEDLATEPVVVLAERTSFWQALADCRWAASSRFLPCTSEGLPVCLVERAPNAPKASS